MKIIKTVLITIAIICILVIMFKPKSHYWFKMRVINDSTANVIIVNNKGKPIIMIDNNIYRHSDRERVKVLMTIFETSIGFDNLMKASETYYNTIDKEGDKPVDSTLHIKYENNDLI